MPAQRLVALLRKISGGIHDDLARRCHAHHRGGDLDGARAINGGHALLTKYGFDGNGYSPKLTNADSTLGNSLATALDQYNNNKLC